MSKLEFYFSFAEGIPFKYWLELKTILEPYAQKCLDGEITKDEYFKICNQEREKVIEKYSI